MDSGGRTLAWVDPLVPVYGTIADHLELSPDRGHHLVFRFHANDLGHATFDKEPLEMTSRDLVLPRYDTEIRFVRVRP